MSHIGDSLISDGNNYIFSEGKNLKKKAIKTMRLLWPI
ncbi:hypothetical protein AC01_2090 [Escherichia coli 1-392-07_S3_C1]|nr:hypothetical protein EC2845350_2735 [Escherichia coli 2845350]ENA15701.1 hypothetical protein ECP02989421_2760 [Escherichia coli P0298942.1]ENA98020.1 hypothetical protein EC2862600_2558 [Escherichia coli 2862600]ENB12312.1 hypothetical protein EC2875150_2766 [Escherichia coli 2875150]ENB40240.1 hypothetical protein ECP029894210_2561 [Escherichia coli P0298942.10]ENB47901.1 hypothetical protein ECP029894211_2634 [Escherichia coli P0298942.11]ENB54592.1 hypothetical protein ECP029894214_263